MAITHDDSPVRRCKRKRRRKRLSPEAEAERLRINARQRRYRANRSAGRAMAPAFFDEEIVDILVRLEELSGDRVHSAVEIGEALVRAVRYVKFD
jgi:hypothetical protein